MRRICTIFSILLALLFAGVQGANALDRLQHGLFHGSAHSHELPSVLTLDGMAGHHEADSAGPGESAGSEDGHADLTDAGGRTDLPAAPHHHHNADHGSSLPAPDMVQASVRASPGKRPAIPRTRADSGSPMTAMERPPKNRPAAV